MKATSLSAPLVGAMALGALQPVLGDCGTNTIRPERKSCVGSYLVGHLEHPMDEETSLLAAIHEEVRLNDYDSSWPERFQRERSRLLALFPDTFTDIQHIGSTAVPGLSAKPIIDMLAGVDSMKTAEALAEPLCHANYTTSAEFNATLTDRKWFMRWSDGRRTHHLHVVVHGGMPWNERLRFRDALRMNKEIANRYASLKSRLAMQHASDREAYTHAKEAFVRSVLQDR